MQTLYSSSFISIVLAFLMFMGYNNQPIEIVQSSNRIHFSNVIKAAESSTLNLIQIEYFDDFTCSNCSRFVDKTLPQLLNLQKESDEISIRLFFVPDINDQHLSTIATSLKCAADQDRFWDWHAKIHENKADLSPESMKSIAEELEMNPEALIECIEANPHQKSIEEDIRYASEKEVTVKPTLLINEYQLIGYQPFENVDRIIRKIEKERLPVTLPALPSSTPDELQLETENPALNEEWNISTQTDDTE